MPQLDSSRYCGRKWPWLATRSHSDGSWRTIFPFREVVPYQRVVKRAPVTTEILISTIALALAAVSLGWNIYRDRVSIYARVKVGGKICVVVIPGQKVGPEEPPEYIVITAANHGPADTTLAPKYGTIFPDYTI